MTKKVGVAILGLGVVGGGTYETLVEHRDFYLKTQRVDIVVEAVLDKSQERLKALNVPEEKIAAEIERLVDLRPAAIINRFGLRRPIYSPLAAYGHMGREDLSVGWEETDLVPALKAALL